MSIRLRLTILYSTILALTLIAFGAALFFVHSQYTLTLLRNDLMRTVNGAAMLVYRSPAIGAPPPVARRPEERWGFEVGEVVLREVRTRDRIQILDADGALVDHPVNQLDEALPLSEEGLRALQGGAPWSEVVEMEGERWLVYSEPLSVRGNVIAIVQAARSLSDRDRSLRALGGTLLVGGTLTTVIACGIGWMLSGLTLRPIHRITQTAQAIGEARDLERRVRHDGPQDEVGQLATTFNAMLARLQGAYHQVERSLQQQRDFVADVSHELRTPLTTIRGNLELLRRDPPIPGEEQADIVSDMIEEADRLIRLVNDLLQLAHADAAVPLQREPVEVSMLAGEVCGRASAIAPGRTVTCRVDAEATALADHDAVRQILWILVDNALTHTKGPVQVTAETRDSEVTVAVQDDGPGMPPEMRDHLFDRFYRGEPARSRPGFGLGLAIAKGLTEALGGSIAVETAPEAGSTFTVTLPRVGEDGGTAARSAV
jgi:two-component system OmpR family sensor kinase